MSGQGRIYDRTYEWLARMSGPSILLHRMFEHEFKALAEGRPFEEWRKNPGAERKLIAFVFSKLRLDVEGLSIRCERPSTAWVNRATDASWLGD